MCSDGCESVRTWLSSLALFSMFLHVSSFFLPNAEMGRPSMTGTKTRTGTLVGTQPVHVWGEGGGLNRSF